MGMLLDDDVMSDDPVRLCTILLKIHILLLDLHSYLVRHPLKRHALLILVQTSLSKSETSLLPSIFADPAIRSTYSPKFQPRLEIDTYTQGCDKETYHDDQIRI